MLKFSGYSYMAEIRYRVFQDMTIPSSLLLLLGVVSLYAMNSHLLTLLMIVVL